ncbi:MAG: hypothetical protein N3C12_02800 [Candidatus Binatia bacterium]|nr:hypothetical protein [Candidatus Binatia bacterium]
MSHRDADFLAVRRLIVLGSLSFASVGIAVVLPGALLPLWIDRLAIELSQAGLLLAVQPLGHLAAVLLCPYLLGESTVARTLAVAGAMLASGLAAIGWLTAWQAALAAMALSGASIGMLEVATNTVLLTRTPQPNRVLNFTHLFFGVASVCTPPAAALALRVGFPWEWLWMWAAVPIAVTALCWLFTAPGIGAQPQSSSRAARGQLGERGWGPTLALAAAMAAYVGAEIGFGSWYTEYATSVYGVSLVAAGYGLAGYWGGLTVGRLLLALWAPGHSSVAFVAGLAVSAAALSGLALGAPGMGAFIFTTVGLGLALAGIFPGILALSTGWYPRDIARVTSALLAGAGLGQMAFPWIMAVLAQHVGLARAMWIYPLLCCLVAMAVAIGQAMHNKPVERPAPR